MKNVCKNKIDVHAHVAFYENIPRVEWYTALKAKELIDVYDKIGVEHALILPNVSPEAHFVSNSPEGARMIAERFPDRFSWATNLDPRMGKNNAETDYRPYLEYCIEHGARAVGEVMANIFIDDELYDNMFGQCAELGLPVTIHISQDVGFYYGMVDDVGLPRLEKMLKKYPKLKIFGHSQAFYAHMSADVTKEMFNGYPTGKVIPGRVEELMDKYENLYCDLSAGSGYNALARDPDYAEKFIERFADRMMFGLDICNVTDVRLLPEWLDNMYLDGRISEQNYMKICRDNAIRELKLDIK